MMVALIAHLDMAVDCRGAGFWAGLRRLAHVGRFTPNSRHCSARLARQKSASNGHRRCKPDRPGPKKDRAFESGYPIATG